MNVNKYEKDLEKLRIILIEKGIIKQEETIGVKQFVKYFQLIRYHNNA